MVHIYTLNIIENISSAEYDDCYLVIILKKKVKCCCNWYLYLFKLRSDSNIVVQWVRWLMGHLNNLLLQYYFNLLFLSEKNLPIVSLEDLSDEGMSVSDIDQFSDEEKQVKNNIQYCTLNCYYINDTLYWTLCSVISAF